MAKISKAVKEKRKDFAKTKLKVGKSKLAPSNQTDTSFTSKKVVVPRQSVNREPSARQENTLEHSLALVMHKNPDIRKDALLQLISYLSAHPPNVSTVLTPLMKCLIPLILDDSAAVRRTLHELFSKVLGNLQKGVLVAHTRLMLLYITSAMSHITPSIRADSSQFLAWAIDHTDAIEIIVTSQLDKFMATFSNLFGWTTQNSSLQTSRALTSHLNVFEMVLDAALSSRTKVIGPNLEIDTQQSGRECFILHRQTTDLLELCQSTGLFQDEMADRDVDLSTFATIEPHVPRISQYLSNKFTDSVNGDRTLCIPVLKVFRTMSQEPELRQSKDWLSCMKKLTHGVDSLRETSSIGAVPAILQEWKSIRDVVC